MAINLKTLLKTVGGFGDMRFGLKVFADRKSRRALPFFYFEGKTYTYGQTVEQARRWANMFLYYKSRAVEKGQVESDEPLPVVLYLDNVPEFLFALFGAALSKSVIIGGNTGFRGDTLAAVINNADATLLITEPAHLDKIVPIIPDLKFIGPDEVLLVGGEEGEESSFKDVEQVLSDPEVSKDKPLPKKIDIFTPLLVVYTSGTTGPPKGVPLPHIKLLGAAIIGWFQFRLGREDKGYMTMPMFHANSWYGAIMALMFSGGSFVLKRKFSAGAFEPDILEHGVTVMNYVGQPLHYIIAALEKKYGSPEAVEAALAKHPDNKFRVAMGTGAPAVDRRKLKRYLGMDHIYEAYGSSEAPITIISKPVDPIESIGKISSKSIVILDENDQVCPPAEVDEKGRIKNYNKAVGELCK